MSSIKKTILFIILLILGLSIAIYFDLKNKDSHLDSEKIIKEEISKSDKDLMGEFEDLDEYSLNSILSFLNSYFLDMNKNKSDLNVEKFISSYFTEDFISNVNVEGVLDSLEEYRKNTKDYKFKYEVMYIKEDKVYGGYYVGVREWSELTLLDGSIKKTDSYGGVYILDNVKGELKISTIVDNNLSLNKEINGDQLEEADKILEYLN